MLKNLGDFDWISEVEIYIGINLFVGVFVKSFLLFYYRW